MNEKQLEAAVAAFPNCLVEEMEEADREKLYKLKCLLPTRRQRAESARARLLEKIRVRKMRS